MKPGSVWVHGQGGIDILERAKEAILARGGVVLSRKPAQALKRVEASGVSGNDAVKSRKPEDAQDSQLLIPST